MQGKIKIKTTPAIRLRRGLGGQAEQGKIMINDK